MSEISERYRRVSDQFLARLEKVPDDAWANPAPPEGWDARDVVRHLVEWLPGFFGQWPIEVRPGPTVDDDPLGAWLAVDEALQSGLDDPAIAGDVREAGPLGAMSYEAALDMICTPDVLAHTWDLARATGLDETLDADEVARQVAGMEAMPAEVEQGMRDSGHYGPRVEVPDDADPQIRMIAFLGRTP